MASSRVGLGADEETLFATLQESVDKAVYASTDKHLGPCEKVGHKGGRLSDRLRAVLG